VSASGVAVGGSDAQFLAAWSASSGGGTTKVRALRFTRADGALDADGGIVLANGVSPLGRPVVVFDGATWLVAWLDGTPPGPYDVRGVRLQPNGTVVDATPRLLASRVAGIAPALASAGSGWLLAVVRPAGPGWWSLDAVPVTP
jgi:hypothetical protein